MKRLFIVISALCIVTSAFGQRPPEDAFPGVNFRCTNYSGSYFANNYGCMGGASFNNIFVPNNSLTPQNYGSSFYDPAVFSYTQTHYYNPVGSTVCGNTGYYTAPNSGAFYKRNVDSLQIDPAYETASYAGGLYLPMSNSLQTSWYVLENPNLCNISYRIYTLNGSAMSNVKTGIAIYKAANPANNRVLQTSLSGPSLQLVAYIEPDQQHAYNLKTGARITTGPFVYNNSVWNTNSGSGVVSAVPKPIWYSKYIDSTAVWSLYEWNNNTIACTPAFSSAGSPSEVNLADINSHPFDAYFILGNMSTGNNTYVELYNPEPNCYYYIQVLVKPTGTCSSPQRASGYYTMSITAELLSSLSYNGSGNFVQPVYLTPVAKYWDYHIPGSTFKAVTYDVERPVITPGSVPVRADPLPTDSILGYRQTNGAAGPWTNTTYLSNVPNGTFFLPQNSPSNLDGAATWGSANHAFWYLGTNFVRGLSYAVGVNNLDSSGNPCLMHGYDFDMGYQFSELGHTGFYINFQTYSAHSSYPSSTTLDEWDSTVVHYPHKDNNHQGNNVMASANLFAIAPNPTNGSDVVVKYISSEPCDEASVKVYSIEGKVCYSNRFTANNNGGIEQHFNLSTLTPGTYIMEVKCNMGIERKQIIITK